MCLVALLNRPWKLFYGDLSPPLLHRATCKLPENSPSQCFLWFLMVFFCAAAPVLRCAALEIGLSPFCLLLSSVQEQYLQLCLVSRCALLLNAYSHIVSESAFVFAPNIAFFTSK